MRNRFLAGLVIGLMVGFVLGLVTKHFWTLLFLAAAMGDSGGGIAQHAS